MLNNSLAYYIPFLNVVHSLISCTPPEHCAPLLNTVQLLNVMYPSWMLCPTECHAGCHSPPASCASILNVVHSSWILCSNSEWCAIVLTSWMLCPISVCFLLCRYTQCLLYMFSFWSCAILGLLWPDPALTELFQLTIYIPSTGELVIPTVLQRISVTGYNKITRHPYIIWHAKYNSL